MSQQAVAAWVRGLERDEALTRPHHLYGLVCVEPCLACPRDLHDLLMRLGAYPLWGWRPRPRPAHAWVAADAAAAEAAEAAAEAAADAAAAQATGSAVTSTQPRRPRARSKGPSTGIF